MRRHANAEHWKSDLRCSRERRSADDHARRQQFRGSLRLGYGGHGPDWDASIDSPLLANLVRFRAGMGIGKWDSEFDSHPDPTVTRFGVSRYVPSGIDWNAQTGKRLILGMEGSGERWSLGLEVEIELPHDNGLERPAVANELLPTGLIGVAIRRRF